MSFLNVHFMNYSTPQISETIPFLGFSSFAVIALRFLRRQSDHFRILECGRRRAGAYSKYTHFFFARTCTHSPAYGDSKLLTRAIEGKEEKERERDNNSHTSFLPFCIQRFRTVCGTKNVPRRAWVYSLRKVFP